MAKVSICIPTYENPQGIRRLLESILTQLYKDYEVIITDDSKSDAVKEAVEAILIDFAGYGSLDLSQDRIRYVKNEKPAGAIANWNLAVSMAQGEYVKLMHHDDWFSDERSLGQFVDLLEQHPEADWAFSGTYQVTTKEDGTSERMARATSKEDLELIQKDYRNLFLGNTIGSPSAAMVRRSAITAHGITYDPELTWLVDEEYYMHLLQNSMQMVSSDRPFISIGLSQTQLTEKCIDDCALQIKEYTYIYRKYHLENETDAYAKRLARVYCESGVKEAEIPSDLKISHQIYQEAAKEKRKTDGKRTLDTLCYLMGSIPEHIDNSRIGAWKDKLFPAGCAAFYLAFAVELLLVILDKSDFLNPYESQLFRITFVLFLAKVVVTKYKKEEVLYLLLWCLLGVVSWKMSGRNELLRMAIFVAAMKGMPVKRVMKISLFGVAAGCLTLCVLSVTGIFGVLSLTQDFGRGLETRYCLGIGHPNAAHCMALMLVLMALYLYKDQLKGYMYAVLLVFDVVLYGLTKSNTGLALMALAIISAAVLKYCPKLTEKKFLYTFGEGIYFVAILFSIGAAIWGQAPLFSKLNGVLNGRIGSLWDTTYHDGTLATWTALGSRANDVYFDMGWVRIFYWYGVIPAICICVLLWTLLRAYRSEQDATALMVFTICTIYTVVEAHLVSVFIGRNLILLFIALYASVIFTGTRNEEMEKKL